MDRNMVIWEIRSQRYVRTYVRECVGAAQKAHSCGITCMANKLVAGTQDRETSDSD